MHSECETGSRALRVKARRPWAVAVASFVTFNVYAIFWYYQVNREMRDYGSAHAEQKLARGKPWHSLLAMTVGCPVVIPVLVTYIRCVDRLRAVERIATGRSRPGYGLTVLLVASALIPLASAVRGVGLAPAIIGSVALAGAVGWVQGRLNTSWTASPPRPAGAKGTTLVLTH
jgi:Domain of unknown function (DUF4234)